MSPRAGVAGARARTVRGCTVRQPAKPSSETLNRSTIPSPSHATSLVGPVVRKGRTARAFESMGMRAAAGREVAHGGAEPSGHCASDGRTVGPTVRKATIASSRLPIRLSDHSTFRRLMKVRCPPPFFGANPLYFPDAFRPEGTDESGGHERDRRRRAPRGAGSGHG